MKKNLKVNIICGVFVVVVVAAIVFVVYNIGDNIILSTVRTQTTESVTQVVHTTVPETTTLSVTEPTSARSETTAAETEQEQTTDDVSSETPESTDDKGRTDDRSEETEYPVDEKYFSIADNGDIIYQIQKGDTLSYISFVFGRSVDEIAEYNHIKNVNLIYADSSIRIPTD